MTRILIVLLAFVTAPAVAQGFKAAELSKGLAAQELIAVHVFTAADPSGFISQDMHQRLDSVEDLKGSVNRLYGGEKLRLVDSPEDAHLTVAILKREYPHNIRAWLTVGSYEEQLAALDVGESFPRTWKGTADALARKLNRFCEDNRDLILRTER